jgi:phospholipid-translocating ATPase
VGENALVRLSYHFPTHQTPLPSRLPSRVSLHRKKLEVGDVVLLRDDEQVPADIVILSTSDADGICYVETKNLDGETNLKVRKALKATSGINSEEDLEHAKFMMDIEPPHANLYPFNGLLKYSS